MIVSCSECGSKYKLPDNITQAAARCKKCGAVINLKQAAAETIVPPAAQTTQRTEQKTVVPGADAIQRAEQQTVIPGADAAQRAEQKTVIPGADAAQKAEQKTVIPGRPPTETAEAYTIVAAAGEQTSPVTSANDPLVGQNLGGYEVIRKLGEGGMGKVFEARQISLDRGVALKTLLPAIAAQKEFVTRFMREALSVAKLNHNNIIQIYDVGKAGDIYYFAMEFVRGRSLQDMIEAQGKIDPETAVGYVVQAARGLEYAHRKNIIHRDIKPDNIMINEDGIAKVADMGLAKDIQQEEQSVTMSGVAMGTPYYIAPEQATNAKKADGRADIYSLGCTLYHMILGKIPYDGASAYEIITKHLKEPLTQMHEVDKNIPEGLSEIVTKMLAKDREERYQTMTEIIADLEEYLGVNRKGAEFTPTEGQIQALREENANIAKARNNPIGKAALLGISALVIICALIGLVRWQAAPAAVIYALTALAGYGLLFGMHAKGALYRRARKCIFSFSIGDWLTIITVITAAVVVALLVMPLVAIGACALGLVTAAGYFVALKRPRLNQVAAALEPVKKLARAMRSRGVAEEDIQLFMVKFGEIQGEFLCEALFGYDALATARGRCREEELAKRTIAASARDWIIRRIDAAEQARLDEKERKRAEKQAQKDAAFAGAATAVMASSDTATEPAAAPEEPELAEILEGGKEEKPGAAAMIIGIPKFLISGKGRIVIGAIMLLLSGLSYKFSGASDTPGALISLNYLLFAFALLISGFTRARAMLAALVLSMLASGPAHLAFKDKTLAENGLGNLPKNLTDTLTPTATCAFVLLMLAFVAAILFRGGQKKSEPIAAEVVEERDG